MEVLGDTSGLYPLLDGDDLNHALAASAWVKLADSRSGIIVHQFVFHETWSLIQSRLGHEALDVFVRDFLPVFLVETVSDAILRRAMSRCRVARRRHLSLTDCVTIEMAEDRGIRDALAFDRHLREGGLRLPTQQDWLEG